MSEKNPTIYDIAKLTGVSPATVSRVLNEPGRVAEEKRLKVLDAIKKLNFVPKAEAVAVARKLYKKIHVIAPFFTQPAFMERLRGVESVLNEEHFEIVIYSIHNQDDLREYISMMTTSAKADGLIVFSLKLEEESLDLLKNAKIPVCFVENNYPDFDRVIIQNVLGGQKAAEYLYSKGCVRPGFIGEKAVQPYTVSATEERFKGYRDFFEEKGIPVSNDYVWIGEFTDGKLEDGINKFLNQKELPDCIFCSSDLIAARFITLAKENDLDIPKDIKVLGFDDIDIAEYIGLSSVSQVLDESGRLAAKFILSHLQEPDRQPYSTLVPVKVVERKTTL